MSAGLTKIGIGLQYGSIGLGLRPPAEPRMTMLDSNFETRGASGQLGPK